MLNFPSLINPGASVLAIPNRGIIQRVFLIKFGMKQYGTAFSYNFNGTQFLITAAHVLTGMQHGIKSEILIFKDHGWQGLEAVPYFYAEKAYVRDSGDTDLAVIKLEHIINESLNLQLMSKNTLAGQDAYFLGFPFFQEKYSSGNGIEYKCMPNNNGYPIPAIKKACVLYSNGSGKIYLDGLNNPGFSGGPTVYWDYHERRHKVLGFISSYIDQQGKVEELTAMRQGKLFYSQNSGIAVTYEAEIVAELLSRCI